MKILETSKFQRLRKKVREEAEKQALRTAILDVLENPETGKKLKGEFASLKSYSYSARGQSRRLIYRWEKDLIVFYSFGPRGGIYQ